MGGCLSRIDRLYCLILEILAIMETEIGLFWSNYGLFPICIYGNYGPHTIPNKFKNLLEFMNFDESTNLQRRRFILLSL